MNVHAIRASAVVSAILFAGILSFSPSKPAHQQADPSVPSASEAFAKSTPAEGNVHDMTY